MALESLGLAKLREKLKTLYFHYHNVYGHQTWQNGDPLRGASTYNVKISTCRSKECNNRASGKGKQGYYFHR